MPLRPGVEVRRHQPPHAINASSDQMQNALRDICCEIVLHQQDYAKEHNLEIKTITNNTTSLYLDKNKPFKLGTLSSLSSKHLDHKKNKIIEGKNLKQKLENLIFELNRKKHENKSVLVMLSSSNTNIDLVLSTVEAIKSRTGFIHITMGHIQA